MKTNYVHSGEVRAIETRLGRIEALAGEYPVGYETIRTKYTHWGEYVYFADFVVSFGARVSRPGDAVTVARLWADDELIYDRAAGFEKPEIGFTFFDGNESQGEVYRGMHYRGQMVARFIDFNLTDYGNNVPAITAELVDGNSGSVVVQAISPQQNNGGYVQLETAYDALFTAGRYTTPIDNFALAYWVSANVARLSSKATYVWHSLTDYLAAGLDSYYDDGVAVWIPELNVILGQPNLTDQDQKRLYRLSERKAPIVTRLGGMVPWNMATRIRVSTGGNTEHFVIGATTEGGVFPIRVTANDLTATMPIDLGSETITCLVPGAERDGRTNFYIVTTSRVVLASMTMQGGVSQEDIYEAPSSYTLTQAWYDKTRDQLVVLRKSAGASGYAVALDSDGIIWESDEIASIPVKTARHYTQEAYADLSRGTLALVNQDETDKLTYLRLDTGDVATVSMFGEPDNFPLDRTTVWDSRTETLYSGNGTYIQLGAPPAPGSGDRITAGDVMRAYALHVGFENANVETINMDGLYIDGYVVTGDVTLGQLATSLGDLYGFAWVERAGTIIFKSIYVDGEVEVDTVIDPKRLAVLVEGQPDHFKVERTTPQDSAPSVISLAYFDPDNSLRPGLQVAQRDAETRLNTRIDLSMPLTIDGSYALELLYGAMTRIWAATAQYELRVPPEGIELDPIDAIEFTANGYEYTAQIKRHRINADYSVSITASEVAANYPVPAEAQPPRVVTPYGRYPVRVTLLDIPHTNPLAAREGYVRVLALLSGAGGAPLGPTVLEMTTADDPTGWEPRLTLGSDDAAHVGTLIAPLPVWPNPFTLDTLNSIYLQADSIDPAKFVSAEDFQLDANDQLNLVAVGDGPEVELVQFKNAAQIQPGIWRLYNLRRGRFGTEVFMTAGDTPGVPVSFLDNAQVLEFTYEEVTKARGYLVRAYNPGQPLWQVTPYALTPVGNSRRPYAPVDIKAREQENEDITITWARRMRGINLPPLTIDDLYMPMPLDEPAERYAVEIYDATTQGFILRADDIEGPEFVWTAAEQTEAGYTPGTLTEIILRVIQTSNTTVGDGFSDAYRVDIFPADAVVLSATFALGGNMVVGEEAPADSFSAHMALGGSMEAHLPDPAAFSARFDLGGAMRAHIQGEIILNPAWLDWATLVLFAGNPETGLVEQLAGDPGVITYEGTPTVDDEGWIYLNHRDDQPGASGDDDTDRFWWTPPSGQNSRTTPTNDWTAEYWIKAPLGFFGTNRVPGILGRSTGNSGSAWYVRHNTNTDVFGFHQGSSNGITKTGGDITTLEDGAHHHVAIVKQGGNVRIYIDGVDQGVTGSGFGFGDHGNPLLVGGGASGFLTKYRAHVDAIRLSNIARYSANFTPTPRRGEVTDPPPAGHYRYYRLYVTAVGGGGNKVQIANLELYESQYGPNVVTSPIARADSYVNEFVPTWGFDGNLMEGSSTNQTHKWESNNNAMPHWLAIDFGHGNEKKIEAFGISNSVRDTEGEARRPVTFKLQGSNDAENWTDVATRTNHTWAANVGFERFLCDGVVPQPVVGSPHGAHKFWRLYFRRAHNPNNPFSAASIEFRATPGGVDQAAGSGGTATGHSQLDSNETPPKAFDGNPSTIWGSSDQGNYNNSWLQYEFTDPVEVAEFMYKVRPDYSFTAQTPRDFQLMYSDFAAGPWTTAWGEWAIPAFTAYGQEKVSTDPAYVAADENGPGDVDDGETVQPTIVGTSSYSGTGSTITLAKPAGLAVGDLMVVHISGAGVGTGGVPDGWSVVMNGYDTANAWQYKIADADDVAATEFEFPAYDSTNKWPAVLTAIRDADPTTPIVSWTIDLFRTSPVTTKPLTVEGDNRLLLVCALGGAIGNAPSAASSSDLTNGVTAAANASERPTQSNGIRLFSASKAVNAGAATGNLTFTGAATSGVLYLAMLVKGKPA